MEAHVAQRTDVLQVWQYCRAAAGFQEQACSKDLLPAPSARCGPHRLSHNVLVQLLGDS
jgi:hypothetical protein